MASVHNFVQAPKSAIVVHSDNIPQPKPAPTPVTPAPETLTYATAPGNNEILLTAIPPTQEQTEEGQQIIQQFQIQLPDQQLVEQIGGAANGQTQQIQIIQTDPNNPEQPQVITLYTWGGN